MDVRARRRVAKAPCTDARMLQLVAALGRRAIASNDRHDSAWHAMSAWRASKWPISIARS
jgi:hypothetical protein